MNEASATDGVSLYKVGLWRSWERASMAWKRSSVRSRPGPPFPSQFRLHDCLDVRFCHSPTFSRLDEGTEDSRFAVPHCRSQPPLKVARRWSMLRQRDQVDGF